MVFIIQIANLGRSGEAAAKDSATAMITKLCTQTAILLEESAIFVPASPIFVAASPTLVAASLNSDGQKKGSVASAEICRLGVPVLESSTGNPRFTADERYLNGLGMGLKATHPEKTSMMLHRAADFICKALQQYPSSGAQGEKSRKMLSVSPINRSIDALPLLQSIELYL